ncbi:MAG: hypothetical protein EOO01_10740, partial [Chitinophagaceae bacterium]
MKKLLLLFTAVAITSCSSDDGGSSTGGTSFNFDGETFQLQPTMGMTEIRMATVAEYNGESYDRSTVTVVGLNGTAST